MKTRVINDTHLGVQRSAGTTPMSAQALTQFINSEFHRLVHADTGTLIVLGDLFDTGTVAYTTLLSAYGTLTEYLLQPYNKVVLVAGNHDLTRDTTQLSSFSFLCQLLSRHRNFTAVFEPTMVGQDYIIPHLPNQQMFDAALKQVPKCRTLMLHCNIDSPFALHSDHSLNALSSDLDAAPCAYVLCAHEHQTKQTGKITIAGNQIPSSIADCLGTEKKCYSVLSDEGVQLVEWRDLQGFFARVSWKEAEGWSHPAKFVRVQGRATQEESALAVSTIANLRKQSQAFVISNAIEIDEGETSGFSESIKDVRAFSLHDALAAHLSPEEMEMLS
jgi:DNA repair exonuclease SbcCD nuclease subunit